MVEKIITNTNRSALFGQPKQANETDQQYIARLNAEQRMQKQDAGHTQHTESNRQGVGPNETTDKPKINSSEVRDSETGSPKKSGKLNNQPIHTEKDKDAEHKK